MIEDFLADVHAAVERIGAPVNLVGDCQGGWLAAIYAALHPDRVHTLTVAGAPIDFHAGLGAPIPAYVDGFTAGGRDMGFYRALVAAGGGVLPGESQLLGFIALKPEAEIRKQLALLSRLDDPEHLERHRAFEDWFKWTQPLSGAFYLWIVEHLFRDNALVRGSLDVGGRAVALGEISCPLYLLAGAEDHITPPAQLFALADHVSTPPRGHHPGHGGRGPPRAVHGLGRAALRVAGADDGRGAPVALRRQTVPAPSRPSSTPAGSAGTSTPSRRARHSIQRSIGAARRAIHGHSCRPAGSATPVASPPMQCRRPMSAASAIQP